MQKQAGLVTTALLTGSSAYVQPYRQIFHMHMAALVIRLSAYHVLLASLAPCLA